MKNLLIIFLLFFFYGCYREEITQKKQIENLNDYKKLNVLTKDSALITLSEFKLINDSLLYGKGFRVNGSDKIIYDDTININEVNYIAGEYNNSFASLVSYGALAATLGIIGGSIESGSEVSQFFIYDEEGSSCPFLYSINNGEKFIEGEAFGRGLGRAFETTTPIVLKNINNNKKYLDIRFTNERPETHYFNAVDISYVKHSKAKKVISDNNDNLLLVNKNLISPDSAVYNKHQILDKLKAIDNLQFESDENISLNYKDEVELTFKNNSNSNGTLVLNLVNTYFGTFTYYYLNSILKSDYIRFIDLLENNKEVKSIIEDYVLETSLKIEVWNGSSWDSCGIIKPEADSVYFLKGVKIETPKADLVKIRLSSLKDVWKIDYAALDYSYEAVNNSDKCIIINEDEELKSIDAKYKVLLPGDSLNLAFEGVQSEEDDISYVVNTTGYLLPWMMGRNQYYDVVNAPENVNEKLEFCKNLIKYRSLFYPILYKEWYKQKVKFNKSLTGNAAMKDALSKYLLVQNHIFQEGE